MLEKVNKVNVVKKLGATPKETIAAAMVVPQNSVSTVRQKAGGPQTTTPMATIHVKRQPAYMDFIDNTLGCPKPAVIKCTHCENMAKNFLYLESLVRTNCTKADCDLCQSTLNYLQYAKKNIIQVYGNFRNVMDAAKEFGSSKQREFTTPQINATAQLGRGANLALKSCMKKSKSSSAMKSARSRDSVKKILSAGGGSLRRIRKIEKTAPKNSFKTGKSKGSGIVLPSKGTGPSKSKIRLRKTAIKHKLPASVRGAKPRYTITTNKAKDPKKTSVTKF